MNIEEINEKIALYERLTENNPQEMYAQIVKIWLYLLVDRASDALKASLESSLTTMSKSYRTQLAIAIGYFLKGKFSEALIETKYAINIDPANPISYLVEGAILLSLDRIEEGKASLIKAVSLPTENTFLIYLKSKIEPELQEDIKESKIYKAYRSLKDFSSVFSDEEIKSMQKDYPDDVILKTLLASIYMKKGKVKESLEILEKGLSKYSQYPERLFLLARIYRDQLGNTQKGKDYLESILKIDPLNERVQGIIKNSLSSEEQKEVEFLRNLENLPLSVFRKILTPTLLNKAFLKRETEKPLYEIETEKEETLEGAALEERASSRGLISENVPLIKKEEVKSLEQVLLEQDIAVQKTKDKGKEKVQEERLEEEIKEKPKEEVATIQDKTSIKEEKVKEETKEPEIKAFDASYLENLPEDRNLAEKFLEEKKFEEAFNIYLKIAKKQSE